MTDSDIIESLIRESIDNGTRRAVIKRKEDGSSWFINRAILIPSDFTLIIDDCTIQLAPGVKDNIIRNEGAVPCAVAPNQNITIKGKGNAVLCGGTECHYSPCRSGDTNGWRTVGILLVAVKNFLIEDLTIRETQAWGVSIESGSSDGIVRNLNFEDTDQMFNQDGVDIRKGCHDILIENITGLVGDDAVALTGLRALPGVKKKRQPPETPYPESNEEAKQLIEEKGRFAMEIGESKNNDEDDIYNITIRNVVARSVGGHGIIRLLCHDGIKMHHISVTDVIDTAKAEEGDKLCYATIRLGDTNYWTSSQAKLGDMHNISVANVEAKGKVGVWIKGPLKDSRIVNVSVPPSTDKYQILSEVVNVEMD